MPATLRESLTSDGDIKALCRVNNEYPKYGVYFITALTYLLAKYMAHRSYIYGLNGTRQFISKPNKSCNMITKKLMCLQYSHLNMLINCGYHIIAGHWCGSNRLIE